MSWGEYLPIVASNVGPSSWEAVKGIGSAIVNPIDTATTVGKLGAGFGAKAIDAAGNAIGYGPVFDPAKKAEREQVADALIENYKNRYGGGQEGEFWKNLAEDPASYASDIATVVSLGAGAATKAGLIDKAGRVARAASIIDNLDPGQAALNAAGIGAKAVGSLPPKMLAVAQSAASGLPMSFLRSARDVGLSGDPAKVDAFMSSLKGNPNFTGDVVDQLEKAIDEMGEQASNAYMTSQSTAFARQQPVDLTAPMAAADEIRKLMRPSSVVNRAAYFPPGDAVRAGKALDKFEDVLTHPNPSARTIQELDAIKKEIDRLARDIKDPSLRGRVSALSSELVSSMGATDGAYLDMMRGWQEYKRQLNNVRKDFGTERMSDAARAGRIAKAFKGRYGDDMFSALEATPSGANLRYSIAGDASKNWIGDRTHATVGALGGPAAAALYAGLHPGIALAAVPSLAAASPKLGAYSQYALGAAQRNVNDFAGGVRDYVTAPVTNVLSQVGPLVEEPQDERIGRKSGGRVGGDHMVAADQLVRAAERAKKELGRSTEPLLNQSDDAVAHALEVANRSI